MTTITLTRKRLAHPPPLDTSGPALDAAFFQQHPQRHYHARLATAGELAKLRACAAMPPVPPGMMVWAVAWQLIPGVRLRHYLAAAVPAHLTHAVPEATARIMYLHNEEAQPAMKR
jgi:hypothetical protein